MPVTDLPLLTVLDDSVNDVTTGAEALGQPDACALAPCTVATSIVFVAG